MVYDEYFGEELLSNLVEMVKWVSDTLLLRDNETNVSVSVSERECVDLGWE